MGLCAVEVGLSVIMELILVKSEDKQMFEFHPVRMNVGECAANATQVVSLWS
jgi:hypothetical protein